MVKKILTAFSATVMLCLCLSAGNAYANAKYSISGFITNSHDNEAVRGAEVTITGDANFVKKTDATGFYRFEDIENGSKVEVSASKEGLSIAPSAFKISRLSSNRTINFKASLSEGKPKSSRTSSQNDVPTIPKPVTGVTSTQPAYVKETKSFFSSNEKVTSSDEYKPTFSISGKVIYYASGLVGVRVTVNNDKKLTALTDGNGNYTIKNLKTGEDFTVSFYKDGYEFNPSEYTLVSVSNDTIINAEAFASKYKISGVVSENKKGIEGVQIKVTSGVNEYEVYTDDRGHYEVGGLSHGSNYLITAYKEGVVLTPLKLIVNKISSDRAVNFTGIVRKFTIEGKVTDAQGKTLRNATVELESPFDTSKTTTNSKGMYSFEDVSSSLSYNLKAVREGYEDSSVKRIVDLQRDQTVDFKLAPAAVPAEETKSEEDKDSQEQTPVEPQEEPAAAEETEQAPEAEEIVAVTEAAATEEPKEETAEEQEPEDKDDRKSRRSARKKSTKTAKDAALKTVSQETVVTETSALAIALASNAEAEEKENRKLLKIKDDKKDSEPKPARSRRVRRSEAAEKEKPVKETKEKIKPPKQQKTEKPVKDQVIEIREKPRKSEDKKIKTIRVRGTVGTRQDLLQNIELTLEPGGFKTVTDSKGRYTFEGVPENSRYMLKPYADDFYFEPDVAVFNDVNTNITQDFVPYVYIEGEVFAEGKAVADVNVNINGVQGAVTNQFGKFKVGPVEYGANANINVTKAGYSFYPASVEIPGIRENRDDLHFISAYSIAGRVTVQGGSLGLGNMEIEVRGSTNTTITTDYGGNFIIPGLAAGGNFTLIPKAGGYSFSPASREYKKLKENFVSQNFSAIKETYTVRGHVNVAGKPIRNALVNITKRALKYFTDDEGNFEITNLDYGGPYIISIESREHDFEPVVIEVLKENMQVEFSTDISLGGTVMSGDKPLPGITVDVNGRKHKTDENGKYLIKGLKYDGDYLVSFSGAGMIFEPAQKEYTKVKKSVLNEQVEASIAVSGRITLNDKAFEGATVIVNGDSQSYKSDANGYYIINNIKTGRDYVVEVVNEGYKFNPSRREYSNLTAGRLSDNYKAVPLGYTVKGTVSAQGRFLKRVPVVIEGTSKSQTSTNDKGEFIFEGLAPNKKYKLTVLSKTFKFESPSGIINNLEGDTEINLEYGKVVAPALVIENNNEDIKQEIRKGQVKKSYFTVSGKASANNEPLKEVIIRSKLGEALTSSAGEYSLSVESGDDIIIEPYLSGYIFVPERITITNVIEDQQNINFAAEIKQNTLHGFIMNSSLKGVRGISISDLNSGVQVNTDSKGAYKLNGLPHNEKNIIVPESDKYNFYPESMEISLEDDTLANDIFAYPKKIKKAEAFIYGGVQAEIYIENNEAGIVMISPEEGRVSIQISDSDENIVKEFEADIAADIIAVVYWDGVTAYGNKADPGEFFAILNGAGFKDERVNFKIER